MEKLSCGKHEVAVRHFISRDFREAFHLGTGDCNGEKVFPVTEMALRRISHDY
jgi:hypothetical protein